MYDELVKKIRRCATDQMHCLSCGEVKDGRCFKRLMTQAADAIEQLSADLERLKDFEAFWQQEAEEALRRYQVAIANKPRWIPVTEQLPEDLTRVIVFCEGGVSYGLCEHLIADDEEVVEWHDFLHYPITPTHWMPLPEPPKEET